MDDFQALLKRLQDQAIRDAAAIDEKFKEQVEEDRRVLSEHERMLESQRLASQQKTPPIEQRRPNSEEEPGQSEREILERVNRAAIERRELSIAETPPIEQRRPSEPDAEEPSEKENLARAAKAMEAMIERREL